MGINDQNYSIVKLDLELFQTLFDKFEPGVVIDSLEVRQEDDFCGFMCEYIYEVRIYIFFSFFF